MGQLAGAAPHSVLIWELTLNRIMKAVKKYLTEGEEKIRKNKVEGEHVLNITIKTLVQLIY